VNETVGAKLLVLTGVSIAAIIKVTVGVAGIEVCGGVAPQAFNGIMINTKLITAKGKFFIFICSSYKY